MSTLSKHLRDVLIVSSGAARFSLVLCLADQYQVIVLSKSLVTEGSTLHAQGGTTAVFDKTDSVDSHVESILTAGADIYDRYAVELIASSV